MENFLHTDLAAECGARDGGEGIGLHSGVVDGCELLRVQIKTPEAALRVGKPMGRYVTLECGPLNELCEMELTRVRRAVAVEIREMAARMCTKRIDSGFSVLVVGLGNAEITPDSLGPQAVRRLTVTRHLRKADSALFFGIGCCEMAAVSPGVLGQTGVSSLEFLQGMVKTLSPDLVVAVDALAARSPERLAATVQLSDTGIVPGSGLGRGGQELTQKTLGVPVMALGVPTVIDSATLVFDALHAAGYGELSDELRFCLKRGKEYFVAPKEIDLLVAVAATLLCGALEKAFSVSDPIA